jgi:hypothetical protein
MEAAMLRCLFGWSTIALFALAFGGSNCSAGPLEDSFAAPTQRDACLDEFAPLRQEAEVRGNLIKAASERHAPAKEACELIGNFVQSEIKMIRYVEANAERCGIPPKTADQLRAGREKSETMLTKVCMAAQQAQNSGPAGPTGDFDSRPLGR